MERRIYGVETEYGITCASTTGKKPPLDAEEAARALFQPAVKRGHTTNMFLENGGRLYLDVGAHPEYATAECDNLWDLLAQDRAGMALLKDMLDTANTSLQSDGVEGKIHLFRNNFDSEGNSYGYHENYLLRRRRDFREVADALVAFFVTRQILTGAGDIKTDELGEAQYVFSARADQMWEAISAATTRARPIINTRDEPLADASEYRRMHVISADSNMAEPTTALKIGATELLLNALDRGLNLQDLALEDPIEAMRQINFDLTGQLQISMRNGKKLRAVDIQQTILDRVTSRLPTEDLTELQVYVVDLWARTIEAVRSEDWEPVSTEIDFAIKKKLLDQYVARSGASLDDPRVERLLLSYHDIGDGGLQRALEENGLMLRLTSPAQVERAKTNPPATTRAALRGKAIAAAQEHRRDLGADWVHLRLEDGSHSVALQDPFATQSDAVDALIDAINAAPPQIPA